MNESAEKYTFDGYTLTMEATGRLDHYGHELVRYEFITPQGVTLFSGEDFGASPLHDTTGFESAKSLLGFLTLQPGDTDEDYFKDYTTEQMNFAKSQECEFMGIYCDEEFTWDEYQESLQ